MEVGVAHVGGGEVAFYEGFEDGGVDADGDVATEARFGPVLDGAEVQEVLEDAEAILDWVQLSVGSDYLGGGGLGGGECGEEDVAAGEQFW